jgi:hypothetical protein
MMELKRSLFNREYILINAVMVLASVISMCILYIILFLGRKLMRRNEGLQHPHTGSKVGRQVIEGGWA